jgi:small redox-active disulfide protein 2
VGSDDDYTLIRVGEDPVGVRGLKGAVEALAQSPGEKTDEEVQAALLEKLGETNYIARSARAEYARAFLNEYRKFVGRPYEEAAPERGTVKVLGPGCAQCDRLTQLVMKTLSEMGLALALEHVTDLKEIAEYGIVATPALVIDGRIVCSGTVPSPRKLKELLSAAARV